MTRTRTIITATLLSLVLLSAWWATPSAQNWDRTDLASFIERNEELLGEARQLVRETNSVKARASLDAGEKLHRSSKELAANDRLLLAAQAAKKAREAILHAIAVAKRDAQLEERTYTAMERARDRLEQGRRLFDEAGDRHGGPARKLLEEAHHQLERARSNARERMFEVALQLCNSSADLSTRAINLLKRDGGLAQRARREIARTDRILERAQSSLPGETSEGRRAYEEAVHLQKRARENAGNEQYRIAVELTQRAREMVLRQLKQDAPDGPSPDRVARELAVTDKLLTEARELAGENEIRESLAILDEAGAVQARARARFDDGHPVQAHRLTVRARDLAKQAIAAADRPPSRDHVRGVLEETDEILGKVAARATEDDNGAAAELVDRARARQRAAWGAFEGDELRTALAQTKIARGLARRALRELGDEEI